MIAKCQFCDLTSKFEIKSLEMSFVTELMSCRPLGHQDQKFWILQFLLWRLTASFIRLSLPNKFPYLSNPAHSLKKSSLIGLLSPVSERGKLTVRATEDIRELCSMASSDRPVMKPYEALGDFFRFELNEELKLQTQGEQWPLVVCISYSSLSRKPACCLFGCSRSEILFIVQCVDRNKCTKFLHGILR